MQGKIARQQFRQAPSQRGTGTGEPQAAALAAAEIGHQGVEIGNRAQHGPAAFGIGFAGSSQAHALRGAVEQYNAQPALEVGDAPAHGGRGNAFALGSPADGAGLGQQEDEARRNAVEWCHVVSHRHHTHRRQISKLSPRIR